MQHLVAYGGRDDHLFIGGVAEGPYVPYQPHYAALEWQYERFINDTGCVNSTDSLSCLRATPLDGLLKAQVAQAYPGHTIIPEYYWTPVVDGEFIPDYPLDLQRKGEFLDVPLMVGWCTNEGSGKRQLSIPLAWNRG